MIWQLTGKLWPGMRSERRGSTAMCDINDDYDNISLDDLHLCGSDCPLLTEGTCPNALRLVGSRKEAAGRASLGETRLSVKSKAFWCPVCHYSVPLVLRPDSVLKVRRLGALCVCHYSVPLVMRPDSVLKVRRLGAL